MIRIPILAIFIASFHFVCTPGSLIAQEANDQKPVRKEQTKAASDSKANSDKVTKPKPKKKPASFKWINESSKVNKAVKHKKFRSASLKIDVGYYIVLPPGYHKNKSKRYPVVYYLHGGRPGSEAKGAPIGSIVWQKMKSGEMSPAIYVFPNGGPVSHYNIPGDSSAQGADVFIKELIPHVDARYRTIADRSGRALEGFSQGGRATMRLSLRYPELFCSAAAGGGGYATEKRISEEGGYENPKLKFAEGDNTWDLARGYAKGDYPKVRWMIYVGDQGFNYENNLEYMEFLDGLGIKHQKLVVPDVDHSGKKIYEKAASKIVSFHAKNFVDEATLNTIDDPIKLPARKTR